MRSSNWTLSIVGNDETVYLAGRALCETASGITKRCSSAPSTCWWAAGDIRKLPLTLRKTILARLIARRMDSILLSDFEQGEIGDLFRQSCILGLEDLVSKRSNSLYRGGRSPDWIKMKNPEHPAMARAKDGIGFSNKEDVATVSGPNRLDCRPRR